MNSLKSLVKQTVKNLLSEEGEEKKESIGDVRKNIADLINQFWALKLKGENTEKTQNAIRTARIKFQQFPVGQRKVQGDPRSRQTPLSSSSEAK